MGLSGIGELDLAAALHESRHGNAAGFELPLVGTYPDSITFKPYSPTKGRAAPRSAPAFALLLLAELHFFGINITKPSKIAMRSAPHRRIATGAGRVVVAAGQQRHARRGAEGRGVEAVVLQAALGQPIQGGHGNRPAKRPGLAKTDVVQKDDHYVGRPGRRLDRERRRRGDLAKVDLGDRLVPGFRDRQDRAVQAAGGAPLSRSSAAVAATFVALNPIRTAARYLQEMFTALLPLLCCRS